MTSSSIVEIQIPCPDEVSANEIAEACLEARSVACSNIVGKIKSAYYWQGKVEREDEILLVMKTRSSLFELVFQTVKKLHPYEVPCIVGLEINWVNEDYRNWVFSVTVEDSR